MNRPRAAVVAIAAAAMIASAGLVPALAGSNKDSVGLADQATGIWYLRSPDGQTTSFYYGNPGDFPIMGDWDCDGVDTPGLYRQSDGYVYLRNQNTQGPADIRFFFGNPGDVPLAGDFDGDGCDTISIYRPAESLVYVINELGSNDGGLGAADFSFYFGDPGDKPFVADFDGDGIDTVGLHRESTGFVYYRNSNTQGNAENQFFYGDPADQIIAGQWAQNGNPGPDTVGIFRPSVGTFYLRFSNSQGNADVSFLYGGSGMSAVSGYFGVLPGGNAPPPGTGTTTTSTTTTSPTTTTTIPGLSWSSGVLDSNGSVGQGVDMLLINDRPFAAYYDASNGDLKTAYCNDLDCNSVTYNWPDFSGSQAGKYPSIAVMPSGNAAIAYLHDSENEVRVAFCDNAACSTSSIVTLIPDHLEHFDLGVGPDGLPALTYHSDPYSSTEGMLHFIKCNDAACATHSDNVVDGAVAPADVGEYSSLDFGTDGLPIISYHDRRNEDLKVAHCDDASCSSATVSVVDASPSTGTFTSIKVLPDGTAGIAYNRSASTYFAKCGNTACTSSSTSFLDGSWGYYTDIAIRQGLPVVSYRYPLFDEVNVAVCSSLDCTSREVYLVATADTGNCCVGTAAIAVDSRQRIWVAFYEGQFVYQVGIVRSD